MSFADENALEELIRLTIDGKRCHKKHVFNYFHVIRIFD